MPCAETSSRSWQSRITAESPVTGMTGREDRSVKLHLTRDAVTLLSGRRGALEALLIVAVVCLCGTAKGELPPPTSVCGDLADFVSRDEIAQLLIEGGRPLTMYEGSTPEITRHSLFFYAAAFGFHDVLRAWAQDRAVLNHAEAATLAVAVQAGDMESIQILLSAGVDPNSTGPTQGTTPLMTAIACGRPEAAKMLLGDERTDIHRQNWQGQDAMTVAVFDGNEKAVMALLDHGYDVGAWRSRQWGFSLVELARRAGNDHIVTLLEAANQNGKGSGLKLE
jgi:hypothetical protein